MSKKNERKHRTYRVYVCDLVTMKRRLTWRSLTSKEVRLRFKYWDDQKHQAYLQIVPNWVSRKMLAKKLAKA